MKLDPEPETVRAGTSMELVLELDGYLTNPAPEQAPGGEFITSVVET